MHHALVYFPKIDLEKINEFRRKYDPLWNVIEPHITLVFPFSDIPEDQIIHHVDTITQTLQPFQIRFNGLMKSFDDYLFFLVKDGKEEIQRVRDLLYSGILALHLSSDIPFIPHITLGSFRTKDDKFDNELYDKAYTEAEEMGLDMHCTFDTVSLIKGDGIKPRTLIKTINLRS